jgi:prenylcysteine oxidase/farnesylcysteine lyase
MKTLFVCLLLLYVSYFFCSCVCAIHTHPLTKTPRIAVVGAGIGGSAFVHFLQEVAGDSKYQIDVYEKESIPCGRVTTIKAAGNVFEAGGSGLHPRNQYMKNFTELLGLQRSDADPTNGRFGIFNGEDFSYLQTGNSTIDYNNLLRKYGFQAVRINWLVNDTLSQFDNIYKLQEEKRAFTSVAEMLTALGGSSLAELTQITLDEYLLKNGYTAEFINELVVGHTRLYFGQNTTVSAFAGMISLAENSGTWHVIGGNNQVCEQLLSRSGVHVSYNTTVIHIGKGKSPSFGDTVYTLSYSVGGSSEVITKQYDIVVVAAPLEKADMKFSGFPVTPKSPGTFQRTVATFVAGCINNSYFQYTGSPKDFPSLVLTMEVPSISFNSIGQESTVYQKLPSETVYKVFSRQVLSEQDINALFSNVNSTVLKDWLANPHYDPPTNFLPFVLDDHMFYLNTIEWAASAMEMSCLSAKNVALITAASLNRVNPFAAPPTAPTPHPKKDEL